MVTEAYVSLNVARLLKDKGFEGTCRAFYNVNGDFMEWGTKYLDKCIKDGEVLCPTHQVAMAWMREKGLMITTDWHQYDPEWYVEIRNAKAKYGIGYFRRYEDAIEKALSYALTKLL